MGPGWIYTFHAPLHRAACEALARATSGPAGPPFGRDLTLCVADLGWSIRLPDDARHSLSPESIGPLLSLEGFADDVLEGLDRGELLGAAVPPRRGDGPDGPAQPRTGPPRAGRRPELGQHAALSAGQGGLPRPPPAPRDPPRGARRPPRRPGRERAGLHSGRRSGSAALPELSPFAAAWIEPGGPESFTSNRPPTPSAGCTPAWSPAHKEAMPMNSCVPAKEAKPSHA